MRLSRLARMPFGRAQPTLAAAVLLIAAALLLAGCGGDEGTNPELLSEKKGEAVLADLEAAEAAFAENDCETVNDRLESALEEINDLGSPPIDKELKLNLRDGVEKLQDAADEECGNEEDPAPEPEPEPEPEPVPVPAPETPEEQPHSPDEEEHTPPEDTTPDQPDVPAPAEPAPEPEPEPEPAPPAPEPAEPAPSPGSGGVGPGSAVGRGNG